jgi:hypothetical protein
MNIEEYHRSFRFELESTIADRLDAASEPLPAEELVFAESVMALLAEVGYCDEAVVCYWSGRINNASLRVTGYAFSDDMTALDLFVTRYFGLEVLQDLDSNEAAATGKEGVRFLLDASTGKLLSKVDPTHEVSGLLAAIHAAWGGLDRLRVVVLTDGRVPGKMFKPQEISGKIVAIEVVDIERLYRQASGKPRDELVLNLHQTLGRSLPCVHVFDADADYGYVLTAIPGSVLRELYMRFSSRLLEANVRTFLGAKRSVNRGIVETLRNEPEHFMAFNNGLVIVCDDVEFERSADGSSGLALLRGFQIVNGGQTTSTIYFASREHRTIDLSHVMVPAKIIVLRSTDDDLRERLIAKVSLFANSQTAVKVSDLSANRAFHVQLEKLATETWCPDGSSRWFYERAAGAYNVLLLKEGSTPAKRRKLQAQYGPRRRLTKNDVARFHESWRGLPFVVAKGSEKNFVEFMDALDRDPGLVPNPLDAGWYRALIAKVLLFRAVEGVIKTREAKSVFRQGMANIAAYTIAVVAERLGDSMDFDYIWSRQAVSRAMSSLLWDWAVLVNAEFVRIAAGQQFSEVAKRLDTWTRVRALDYTMPSERVPELRQLGADHKG